jgi:hypothetical protein
LSWDRNKGEERRRGGNTEDPAGERRSSNEGLATTKNLHHLFPDSEHVMLHQQSQREGEKDRHSDRQPDTRIHLHTMYVIITR